MRILLADADRAAREGLAACLEQWGYSVVVAFDGAAAASVLLGSDPPPLALLEAGLPGAGVADLCRSVRERLGTSFLVLVTDRGDDATVRAVLEAGADDFLYRPFDEHELKAHLRTARRILDLQQAARDAEAAFRYEVRHDALTGTLNRQAILETLRHEIDRAAREHTSVGVVVLDVDDFRGINERHGTAGGDAVLREIARRLSTVARTYDSVGRYAASEFLLVLPGCTATQAASLGERIRGALAASAFRLPAGPLPVTASLGAAASAPGLPADALVTSALAAAEAAASHGGNGVRRAAELR